MLLQLLEERDSSSGADYGLGLVLIGVVAGLQSFEPREVVLGLLQQGVQHGLPRHTLLSVVGVELDPVALGRGEDAHRAGLGAVASEVHLDVVAAGVAELLQDKDSIVIKCMTAEFLSCV